MRAFVRPLAAALASLAAAFAALSSASAGIVTFSFTAELLGVAGTPAPGGVTDIAGNFPFITGTFSYDTDAPAFGDGATSRYYATGSVSIDQFSLDGVAAPFATGVASFPETLFSIAHLDLRPPGLNDLLYLIFTAPWPDVFDSPALPLDMSLADFNHAGVGFVSTNGEERLGSAGFELTSLARITPVPLPGAAAPFLAGLAGLAFGRRFFAPRRRRAH